METPITLSGTDAGKNFSLSKKGVLTTSRNRGKTFLSEGKQLEGSPCSGKGGRRRHCPYKMLLIFIREKEGIDKSIFKRREGAEGAT